MAGSGPLNQHNHPAQRWVIKHPVDFNSVPQDIVSSNPSSPSPILILQINDPLFTEKHLHHLYLGCGEKCGLQKRLQKVLATAVSLPLTLLLSARPLPGARFCQKNFVFACFQSNTQASHRYLMCYLHFREYHLCIQLESRAFLSASGIYRSFGGTGRAKHEGKQNSICEMG